MVDTCVPGTCLCSVMKTGSEGQGCRGPSCTSIVPVSWCVPDEKGFPVTDDLNSPDNLMEGTWQESEEPSAGLEKQLCPGFTQS